MVVGPPLFLYSTNVYMKYLVQETYRGGKHYVWCSEYFDPMKHSSYGAAYGIPVSSSPAHIYRRLKEDCDSGDTHSAAIKSQRDGIITRAGGWFANGEITKQQLEDITFMAQNSRTQDWRPVIYVIRSDLVAARLEPVAASERAGVGMEYRITDLTREEFDLIEV